GRASRRRAWRRAASRAAGRDGASTTLTLPDAPAAVDHEVVAGDPGAGVRGEERHRTLEIHRLPVRPSRFARRQRSTNSGSVPGPGIWPGGGQLTVMPCGPISVASARVRLTSAPFAARYGGPE